MTKKHFEAFAATIREDIAASARFGEAEVKRTTDAARYAANIFATLATRDNPRFDRDRFFKACGLLS